MTAREIEKLVKKYAPKLPKETIGSMCIRVLNFNPTKKHIDPTHDQFFLLGLACGIESVLHKK